jgi:hypothetical protein
LAAEKIPACSMTSCGVEPWAIIIVSKRRLMFWALGCSPSRLTWLGDRKTSHSITMSGFEEDEEEGEVDEEGRKEAEEEEAGRWRGEEGGDVLSRRGVISICGGGKERGID